MIRSRYWYSSCRVAVGRLAEALEALITTGTVATAESSVNDGDMVLCYPLMLRRDVFFASKELNA